ncbi:hypothetical protein BKA70DRAFT_1231912 [Coprinopsis sp. MPI-PUGE-AT-0042]|nr:hypothetical protein BKA70DRAFT_1231912 [Coprinopsis sp. MPI-PUGE-AT-0042]
MLCDSISNLWNVWRASRPGNLETSVQSPSQIQVESVTTVEGSSFRLVRSEATGQSKPANLLIPKESHVKLLIDAFGLMVDARELLDAVLARHRELLNKLKAHPATPPAKDYTQLCNCIRDLEASLKESGMVHLNEVLIAEIKANKRSSLYFVGANQC